MVLEHFNETNMMLEGLTSRKFAMNSRIQHNYNFCHIYGELEYMKQRLIPDRIDRQAEC